MPAVFLNGVRPGPSHGVIGGIFGILAIPIVFPLVLSAGCVAVISLVPLIGHVRASNLRSLTWNFKTMLGLRSRPAPVGIGDLNAHAATSIYKPLRHGQIRLVRIHSLDVNTERNFGPENISCDLVTVNLDDNPDYQALSYVWGSQSEPKTIQLNQQQFFVTQSLSDALTGLRLPGTDRVIWIDALAINQSDIDERARQVEQMTRVYAQSRETIVWVGYRRMVSGLQSNGLWTILCARWRRSGTTELVKEQELSLTDRSHKSWNYHDHGSILFELSGQEYWHRAWTAQEILYSRQVTLIIGSDVIPFSCLVDLMSPEILQEHPMDRELGLLHTKFRKCCLTLKPSAISAGEFVDLEAWIESSFSRRCWDARDHVFGFWGCFPLEVRQHFRVDYSLTTAEVFKQVTLTFLGVTGNLNNLRRSNDFNYESMPSLQSWVPALDPAPQASSSAHVMPREDFYGSHHLSMQSESRSGRPAFLQFLDGSTILHVKGTWIGDVVLVTPRYAWERNKQDSKPGEDTLLYLTACMWSLRIRRDDVDEFARAIQVAEVGWGQGLGLPVLSSVLSRLLQSWSAPGEAFMDNIRDLARRYQRNMMSSILCYSSISAMRAWDPVRRITFFGITWGQRLPEKGDRLCLVEGCSRALILRPKRSWIPKARTQYKIVGSGIISGGGLDENTLFDKLRSDGPLCDIFLA